MIDLIPSPAETLSGRINTLIDHALEVDNAAEPPRDYLGGSIMGEECLRYLWFKIRAPEYAKPFAGRFVRRTRLGHAHEEITRGWMKRIGFIFEPTGSPRLEWEVAFKRGRTAGHVDGLLLGGPADLPFPVLWEHKIMKAEYWREAKKNGVAVSHPTYHAQCVIYADRTKTNGTLFMALNTDTSELHAEFVKPDPGMANALFMRADKVIAANTEHDVPRIAVRETDFKCKWCDFRDHCWRPQERAAAPTILPEWAR